VERSHKPIRYGMEVFKLSQGHRKKTKVIIAGIDGAPLRLIEELASAGKLPTFSQLLKKGCSGHLESVIPVNSACAWTSCVTGKNPAKHGIPHFFTVTPDAGKRIITSRDRIAKPIWGILSEREKKVGIVNVPLSPPPEPVNGFMITAGMGVPYPMFYPKPRGRRVELERYLDSVDDYFDALTYLSVSKPWDLFMFVLSHTDHAAHWFWDLHDPNLPSHDPVMRRQLGDVLVKVYQRVDTGLGKLLDSQDEEPIFLVVSDHGTDGISDYFALNKFFQQIGLQRLKFTRMKMQRNILLALRKLGFSVNRESKRKIQRASDPIVALIPNGSKEPLSDIMVEVGKRIPMEFLIDWSRTVAYCVDNNGSVIITVEKKETSAGDDGKEFFRCRQKVKSIMEDIRDPTTGQKVFGAVHFREELFSGPALESLPDIMARPVLRGVQVFHNRSPWRPVWSHPGKGWTVGMHTPHGVLIASGNGIRSNATIKGASILDITPTVLHLLDIEVSQNMDGKVLKDLFDKDSSFTRSVRFTDDPMDTGEKKERWEFTKEGAKVVLDRLRSLGYI